MNEVEKYLQTLEPQQRESLEKIRSTVRGIVPDVTEGIGYGMPVFKYKGKYLIGYAGFKNHLSVFPGAEPIEVLSEKLKDFKTSKGTVQFTREHPLTESLLIELIELCIKRIDTTR